MSTQTSANGVSAGIQVKTNFSELFIITTGKLN